MVVDDVDRQLRLTDQGLVLARRVVRKHRLAERLLTDIIGLPWPLVHAEADRWEHVISDAVERRIVAMLDDPGRDPYGNPIPGLRELGVESDPLGLAGETVSLVEAMDDGGARRGAVAVDGGATDDRGSVNGPEMDDGGARGAGVTPAGDRTFVLIRISEGLQADPELLDEMAAAGVVPGTRITVKQESGRYHLTAEGSEVAVAFSADSAKSLHVV
jgi:DtxR family Mn-dependent transcriptional regulator